MLPFPCLMKEKRKEKKSEESIYECTAPMTPGRQHTHFGGGYLSPGYNRRLIPSCGGDGGDCNGDGPVIDGLCYGQREIDITRHLDR